MEFLKPIIDELSIRPYFWLLSIIMLGSAFLVVTLKNIFHAAIYFILCLLSVVGLFIALHATFVATVQVIICVGAAAILMIFILSLAKNNADDNLVVSQNELPVSIISAVFALGIISLVIMTKINVVVKNQEGLIIKGVWVGSKGELPLGNMSIVSNLLTTEFLFPVVVILMILISTFIGAKLLINKKRIKL